ncbi:hypothetical protein BC941DRAFT_336525, partial [Chlamydoabsidia padenii]
FYAVMMMSMMVLVVKANMSPSNPEPGTVWTAGKEYEITWDNTEPTINATWKNFRIDLMTGEDNDQVLLTNIAENVRGDEMKYNYTAPQVDPPAPIYFLMFTNEDGEFAWSTRFAIVGQDGKQQVPEQAVQPTGEKIPWGVGKLVADGASTSDEDVVSDAALSSPVNVSKTAAMASPSAASQQMVSKPMVASSSSIVQAATPSIASARKGNVGTSETKS